MPGRSQEEPGREEPGGAGGASRSQEDQGEPGGARKPGGAGGARKSQGDQGEPGGVRKSQEEPVGGARNTRGDPRPLPGAPRALVGGVPSSSSELLGLCR